MRLFSGLLIAMLPASVAAHDYILGDLVIAHPVAFETQATAMSGAGYLSVTNNGATADRLIAVEADFPRVTVHDTVVENDVSTMVHLDGVDIAPGETLTLMPGGKHVMFMGLNGDPFEVGEKIEATLVFEQAGRVDITFNVEERPADGSHGASDGHSGH